MYKNHLKNCLVSCFSNVINGLRPVNLDYRIKSGNDIRERKGVENIQLKDYRNTSGNDIKEMQCGRSMIEMLGVLAIIGVLSVGGIAGYSKAMTKWKINKTISDYTYFMFKSIEYQNDLYKLPEDTGLAK